MREATTPRRRRPVARAGIGLAGAALVMALVSTAIDAVGRDGASGAVPATHATLTARDCRSTECLLTLTVTWRVPIPPTGTVDFGIGSTSIPASGGGTCAADPMVSLTAKSSRAFCVAAGLAPGRHTVIAQYSGDTNVDPSWTQKRITVQRASS